MLRTWDVLRGFGFEIDPDVMDDKEPGLSFDFGNFKLTALFALNRYFRDVVHCGGILVTERTFANVEFEVPQEVASEEQCAAFLAYCLDSYADGPVFLPRRDCAWLDVGRRHKHLLPWEIERAKREQEQAEFERHFRARPHCYVDRRFLRLALNAVTEQLTDVSDDQPIVVRFNGQVLSFGVPQEPVVVAASGIAWPQGFSVLAGKLKALPKRLRGDKIPVGIWESHLQIGNHGFSGSYTEDNAGEAETP